LSRSPHNRIRDIEAAVAAIKQFEQAGRDEPVVFDAVRMRLLEIGEAANGIPQSLRETEPTVPVERNHRHAELDVAPILRHRPRLRMGHCRPRS
jgi:uncharacterized protein with HEPN domain